MRFKQAMKLLTNERKTAIEQLAHSEAESINENYDTPTIASLKNIELIIKFHEVVYLLSEHGSVSCRLVNVKAEHAYFIQSLILFVREEYRERLIDEIKKIFNLEVIKEDTMFMYLSDYLKIYNDDF